MKNNFASRRIVRKMGFILKANYKDGSFKLETGFDEFTTDYKGAQISVLNGLPYTLGYHGKNSPADFENFSKVLYQSGISFPDLTILHRNKQLREILLKVASGARNISISNEADQLDFAVPRLLYLSSSPTLWKDFQQFYPGIDPTRYYYYVDPTKFKEVPPIEFNNPQDNIPGQKLGCTR